MSATTDNTQHARPSRGRPQYGLQAWQATIGYIASEYSPDALLTLIAYPAQSGGICWQASASWGRHHEEVGDQPSLAVALGTLWVEVDRRHRLIKSLDAGNKRPVGYKPHEWLDPDTDHTLERLLQSAAAAFGDDWRVVLVYQPVENPAARVQARLIARGDTLNIGGRGATVIETCRLLYRKAAHEF